MAKESVKEVKETVQEPVEQKFPLEALRKHCLAVFGCTTTVFDAATCGVTGEHTKTEVKAIIDRWSKTPVKI